MRNSKSLLGLLSLFLFVTSYGMENKVTCNLTWSKGGDYSVKVARVSIDSLHSMPKDCKQAANVIQSGIDESQLLFSPTTDYEHIYGDSGNVKRGFETVQMLEGKVDDTEGRESVVVMALNCRTGGIFKEHADKNGNFRINVNEFVDSTVFNIDAYDNLDKRRKYNLSLIESPVPNIPRPKADLPLDKTVAYNSFDTARILKNIEVTAKKQEVMNMFKVDTKRAYYAGDPAIYRHTNISSLLKTLGVYDLTGTTILLDNQIIQRSTDTEDDYTFDSDITGYLNSLNINEIWQIEYIKNDPRTMMFQSNQNAKPVLLIYTKFGNGGREAMGRPLANSFTPMGYVPNEVNTQQSDSGDLLLWYPELRIKDGESLRLDVNDTDLHEGIVISVNGFTDSGEYVDCSYLVY